MILRFSFKYFLLLFACISAYILLPENASAQKTEEKLKEHITFLASDKLEGRLTGTENEGEASKYIKNAFNEIGLKAGGEFGTFYQTFSFHTGYHYGKQNSLKIGKKKFKLDEDFYPLAYSSNGKIKADIADVDFGIISEELKRNDYEGKENLQGKILLINLALPENANPHTEAASWKKRLEWAKKYNPAAIIFYNSPEKMDVETFKKFHNLQQENIPLMHVSQQVAENIKSQKNTTAQITVNLARDEVHGRNVIGLINNNRSNTIIIGAHYDHLGYGEYGNSLYLGKEKQVNNGADDNASGTAALIELARLIKNNGTETNYNYIFVAFSGEELGLLGSNFFVKNLVIPYSQINCMLNMDMVGRLDSATHELGIYGVGTSPQWNELMQKVQNKDYFKIKTTESGIGNSDHSSFYMKDIPVLHFFTGTHPDYHKPTDDADKINYAGEAEVVNYIYNLVKMLDDAPKITFSKTKDESASTPKFNVTLGIVPDYFYEGKGIRIDGISPEKSAEKAGLKAGDVILQVGDYKVDDMHSYMEMLGKYNKGDEVKVHISRGEKMLQVPLKF